MDGAYRLQEFVIPEWPLPAQWVDRGQFATLDTARTAAQAPTLRDRLRAISQDDLLILTYHDNHEIAFVDDL